MRAEVTARQIEQWSVDKFVPYARNPRKNDAVVDRMVASINEFGFKIPVLARSSGEVIDGHLRLKAAQKLKLDAVPVILCDEWTDAQVKAFRLMVNRSAAWADWDEDLLERELEELRDLEFDLNLTGFDGDELAVLLNEHTTWAADEDEVPEVPKAPITRLGDLWILGRHRLLCGDSTKAQDVQRLLGGVKPHLLVSDPPYGVSYDPKWRAEQGLNSNRGKLGMVANDDKADWREAWQLFGGDVAYVWHAGRHANIVQTSLESCRFEIRNQIIWAKDRFALSRGHYHWQHEPCWYAVRGNGHWNGDRSQSTLWSIKSREDNGLGHGTQKPVECMRRPILNNSSPGQAVYEPFCGSGTTVIACESEGRHCYALEILPAYCDVIVERWQKFTGGTAIRDDGTPFSQLQHQGSTATDVGGTRGGGEAA